MAIAISRNSNLRCIYRALSSSSYTLNQLKSTITSFRLFHGVTETLHHQPLPFSQPDFRLGHELRYLAIYHRCLCSSTATSTTVNQSNTASEGTSDSGSGKGEKSEQSKQTGEQGKPVRGGPVSWLSFLLLLATGAGVTFYYDREKKRHIEGR